MNKLTVCLMNDSFPPIIDGVANAVVNYATNIERDWGHAIVATPAYPGSDDTTWSFPVVRYPSIDVRKLTSGYMAGIPFSPELSSFLLGQQVDILHSHCPMTSAILCRALRKRINAPMIMTYHTKYDIDIANVVKSKALQTSGIQSVVTNTSAFDEVWVVSDGAGQNLKSLGYQGDYIVMPNGVDIPRGHASKEMVQAETGALDLPEDVPVFLYVGRLMWYKGLRITLDALKMLDRSGEDFRMIIIGSGGDEIEIKAYTRQLGLEDKVRFVGVISDRERIRAWYTRADLFLFPSTFDSNGLVVREAAACDLASVLIAGSCAAEGVHDDHNAFLIEENALSMAELLKKAVKDREHLRQVGVHAGEELYMSWEDAVVRAVERYHIVLELYRSGAYKERATFSDGVAATQGDLMVTAAKVGKALIQGKVIAQYIFAPKDTSGSKSAQKSEKKAARKSARKSGRRAESRALKKTRYKTKKDMRKATKVQAKARRS